MFGWVTAFCALMIATAATVVWSLLDRHRENYAELHKWFRLFVRFALAEQMFAYGIARVFLVQMGYPSLTRLVQPFGTFSPYGVLENSIGLDPTWKSSPAAPCRTRIAADRPSHGHLGRPHKPRRP